MLAYKRHEDIRVTETQCVTFNGISFNVVDSEAWREMVRAIAVRAQHTSL